MSLVSNEEIANIFKGVDNLALRRIEKMLEVKNTRLNFALDHHVNTHGEKLNFTMFPHIRDLYSTVAQKLVIQGSVQGMKAASVNSVVHTPSGWVRMGDLKVGDVVSTSNGLGAKVLQIQPRGIQKLYKFYLHDGREVETTCDHKWKVLRGNRRLKVSKGRKSLQWDLNSKFEILTTNDIIKGMSDGTQRFTIPVPVTPVEKPNKSVPFDPYFVGLMLGDGEIQDRNLRFCSDDLELVNWVMKYVNKWDLSLGKDGDTINYYFRRTNNATSSDGSRILKDIFKSLELLNTYSNTKFIPTIYKNGSVSQRLAILQGLLDTDGCADEYGGISITLTSEQLIKDIQELVWSLGGIAKYVKREAYCYEFNQKIKCKDCYILTISMPHPIDCFRLSRKQERVAHIHRRKRTLGAKILYVEESIEDEVQCIVVDDVDHLYIMDNYVITHNTEFVIVDHLAMAYSGLSIFFVVPDIEARTTYVQNRVNKCIDGVPLYKDIIQSGSFDSIFIKNFGKGTIKYVGSNVLADFKEYPASAVYVDEVDECNQENIEYALDRVRGSPYQFTRHIGNPRDPGVGINSFFLESDQREWGVPCLACGKPILVDWFKTIVREIKDRQDNVVDYILRDTEWYPGIHRDVRMICPYCQGMLHRESVKGYWEAQNPDNHEVEGYHISMMVSLINNISGMWRRFKKAQEDNVALRHFYNSELGLPFAAAGNKVTELLLQKCVVPGYNFVIREECGHIENDCHVGPCTAGIDVGACFDIRISYITGRGNRLCVYVGKIKDVDELYDILERYNVSTAVVDIEPETALSREIQQNARNTQVLLCKFRYSQGLMHSMTVDDGDGIVSIDRTEALDKSFSQLKRKKNLLPTNFAAILSGQYMAEMLVPIRKMTEDAKGRKRAEWTSGQDHSRLADAYDMLAAELIEGNSIEALVG